jgi:hypothetical protein
MPWIRRSLFIREHFPGSWSSEEERQRSSRNVRSFGYWTPIPETRDISASDMEYWFGTRIDPTDFWMAHCMRTLEQLIAILEANTPINFQEMRDPGGDEHFCRAMLHDGKIGFWLTPMNLYTPGALPLAYTAVSEE